MTETVRKLDPISPTSMTTFNSSDDTVNFSDESVAMRMANSGGLGNPIFDEEYLDAMSDLGHNIIRGQ